MAPIPPFARFWMVCRKPMGPGAQTNPRERYSTFEDAQDAARKLARQNNAQFLILQTVAIIRPDEDTQEGLF